MTRSTKGSFLWVWSILGSITTAVSVISIVQRMGDIQLHKIPFEYLTYYRSIVFSLTEWIPLPFSWSFPLWYTDLMIICAITIFTVARTIKLVPIKHEGNLIADAYKRRLGKKNVPPSMVRQTITIFIIWVLAPLTILWCAFAVYILYYKWKNPSSRYEINYVDSSSLGATLDTWFRVLFIMLGITIFTTFVFFLTNYLSVKTP